MTRLGNNHANHESNGENTMSTISVKTLTTDPSPNQSLNRLDQSQVDAFNRDGLLLVPGIFHCILAFGSAEYIQPESTDIAVDA